MKDKELAANASRAATREPISRAAPEAEPSAPGGPYPEAAVRIVARACYEAQWDEDFDSLSPAGIEYAMALQVGVAALDAIRGLATIHSALTRALGTTDHG